MVFKASKKSPKSAASSSQPASESNAYPSVPPEAAAKSKDASISVEDLVGIPQESPLREVVTSHSRDNKVPEEVHHESKSDNPRTPHDASGMRPRQRMGYGGHTRFNQYRQAQGGYRRDYGMGRANQGNNGGRLYGKPGDTGNADPYRGNGYTQDINVPTETVNGMLDIMPEGHGFLRPKFTPSDRDVYISQSQIRRFLLRNGDAVEGQARAPKDNERYWGLLKVEKVNDKLAEEIQKRPKFEDLVPIYPNKLLTLETGQLPLSTRILDLVAPIGFGQRGLIVSPPKAGKTTILKEIAAGVAANYPDVHLMAALIGERPEEVTDISRSVKGEVLASNFDESPQEQTRIAEVALDRAKRLVEMGRDVVILLDSITRLARAYNLVVNPSGRTLSGGFDPAALYPAKRFLGAARCVETSAPLSVISSQLSDNSSSASQSTGQPKTEEQETENRQQKTDNRVTSGGSLTVIGTALVDTGSRMDDLIYEEFKGTGNMELHLSRVLQERRIFPAIDIGKSGTRHDELLLGEEAMKKVTTLRHMLSMLSDEERTLMLVERLSKTKDNAEFLASLTKG